MNEYLVPELVSAPQRSYQQLMWPKEQLLELVKKRIVENSDLDAPIEGTIVPPLMLAASDDIHIESLQLLLDRRANPEVVVHPAKQTPLYQAACKCAPKSIEALLKKKADPNNILYAQSQSQTTPLHAACHPCNDSLNNHNIEKRFDAIRLLLIAKADPNARDRKGETPLWGLVTNFKDEPPYLRGGKLNRFLASRKQLINLFFQEDVYPSLQIKGKGNLVTISGQSGNPILSIHTQLQVAQRKKEFKALLCEYFTGRFKPGAASDFRKLPSDLIKIIIHLAYP